MEKKRISDERLAELIRAAALRRRSSCGTGGGVNAGRSRQWLATARLPSRR